MASVIICSDFRAQENEVCHCFHCFPVILPWSDGTRCRVVQWGTSLIFGNPKRSLQYYPWVIYVHAYSVVSDSVRPQRWQPTRLPRPWDSPDKSTGVGCHFLLQCMKVKSESEVAQLYLTLSDPMDCSLPGSSVHGVFQVRVLEWSAIAFSTDEYTKMYSTNFLMLFL